MARDIRITGIKRKEIDHEKLALAVLMLAKILHDQKHSPDENSQPEHGADEEAA